MRFSEASMLPVLENGPCVCWSLSPWDPSHVTRNSKIWARYCCCSIRAYLLQMHIFSAPYILLQTFKANSLKLTQVYYGVFKSDVNHKFAEDKLLYIFNKLLVHVFKVCFRVLHTFIKNRWFDYFPIFIVHHCFACMFTAAIKTDESHCVLQKDQEITSASETH